MTEENPVEEPMPQEELTAYAGRWIAVADGRVAGVGKTAMAAERLGRRNRVREKLEVYFVEKPGGELLNKPELLERLAPVFMRHDQPVYLVGGSVRDLLLGRACNDLDFAVPERAIGLAFKVADKLGVPAYVLDQDRDTGRVLVPDEGMTLDFAGFRGDNLEADLRDRDFTVNAIALPVAAQSYSSLIDPCDGIRDLAEELFRQTNKDAISDDPVRALRGLRLALQLGFTLESSTSTAIREAGPLLKDVSCERVRDELVNMLTGEHPNQALEALDGHALLVYVLPEVASLKGVEQSTPHREAVLAHTISVLASLRLVESVLLDSYIPDGPAMSQLLRQLGKYQSALQEHFSRPLHGPVDGRLLLRLGAVFHDVGKTGTRSEEKDGRIRFFGHEKEGGEMTARRLQQLHFSRQAVEQVRKIVEGYISPLHLAKDDTVSRRATYRFFRRNREAGLDIGLLSLADYLATFGGPGDREKWTRLLGVIDQLYDHYFNHYDETIRPVPLIDGSELMEAFSLDPGPEVGRLLRMIEEGQAAGEINSIDEAITLAGKALNG
jgi:putative nucleotidyltransferase with HDIG domain